MKYNIIKAYQKEKKLTDDALSGVIDSDESYEFLADKLTLLDEIIEYIESYEWIKQDKVKNRINFFIESGFDYDLYCKTYKVSYESARNSSKYAYKLLEQKLGENTLDLIKKGLLDEARAAFYARTGKIKKEKYIIQSLIEILPDSEFTAGISLADCRNELTILYNMSMWRLNFYKYRMNKDNMAYVLHLLEGNSKRADLFRPPLIAFLTNQMTYEDLLKAEEDIVENKLYN